VPTSNPFVKVLYGLVDALTVMFGPDFAKQEHGVKVLCLLVFPTLAFAALFSPWVAVAYLVAALIFGRE
jgi:hypothetical protein